MAYYTYLFSPDTHEAFIATPRDNAGVRERHQHAAERLRPGDILVCYLTRVSRWLGLLKVLGERPSRDDSHEPFVVRMEVEPLAFAEDIQHAIPIRLDEVWSTLSFTRDHDPGSSTWTGKIRGSLAPLDRADGEFLEGLLTLQSADPRTYPLTNDDRQKLESFAKLDSLQVRRADSDVPVSVPEPEPELDDAAEDRLTGRTSHQVQATLARLGLALGLEVWAPRSDRERMIATLDRGDIAFLDRLPLNYDEVTLRTIENIDVLWLRGRSIVRAFEVEHTTSVYSGILRMADLLALQPNMDIKLHLVAPSDRRERVFRELRRPVFSLLERGPLAQLCTYLSYEALEELAALPNLRHMRDSVIDEYVEEPEEV
ncbi:MAG: hypothetical protein OXG95_01130 [Chloroflexi bacterium]|nr:hypothetical protein [Chloroflexota bacterium]